MRFQVDLHTHTVACSHAYSTLGEYVEQAVDTGISMFATTDHGPDLADGPHARLYPIDYEEVLACAKEHNVAIEINASTSVNARFGSHDNCVKIAKIAARLGNAISLGSDAHIASFLGCFDESIKVLEDAGLGYENVINTSPAKVLDFLESRGHAPIKEMREYFTPFQ